MIKPKRLKKGATIGIISPSWGGPNEFPHIYLKGIEVLKDLGFKIKEFPHTKSNADYLYKNPKLRAQDVCAAFLDKDVDAIFVSIGGDDSVRILPYLDVEMILNNPKIIMGYSDTTTILTYLNQKGLVTFYGPTVMSGFSQLNSFEKDFKKHIEDVLLNNNDEYIYKPYKNYSEGYPDWNKIESVGLVNPKKNNSAWKWLQGSEKCEGELFGGCIEVLEFMKATEFWCESSFWKNKILFFETSEEKPSVDQVSRMLRNYGMQGVFDKISALIFGRARDYSTIEKKQLDDAILNIVVGEFGNNKIPIITDMDFGHTDPQWILPLGIKAQIDCKKKEFKLVEKIY